MNAGLIQPRDKATVHGFSLEYIIFGVTNMIALLLTVSCFLQESVLTANLSVNFAVIISNNNSRLFSHQKITPALKLAEDTISKNQILSDVNISVYYGDSKCTPKDAPIEAFNFYMRSQVSVFLGPVCDYSLAPVARYAPFWNIPVVSPGGFAHDFGEDKSKVDAEYTTLTRTGVTFNSLSSYVIYILQHYQWNRVKLVYDANGHSSITPRFCYLVASALVAFSKAYKLDYSFHMFIPRLHRVEDMLEDEVGTSYAADEALGSFRKRGHMALFPNRS